MDIMDISADFLYGIASVIGGLSILVAMYGIIYKVPVAGLLAILKEVRELFLSKANKIKQQNTTEENPPEPTKIEIGANENNEKGALL